MSYQDICYLSATEALDRFRRRELSPVELMQAIIKRAERMEPGINAFTATFYERALDQANKAEQGNSGDSIPNTIRPILSGDRSIHALRGHALRGQVFDFEFQLYFGHCQLVENLVRQ